MQDGVGPACVGPMLFWCDSLVVACDWLAAIGIW